MIRMIIALSVSERVGVRSSPEGSVLDPHALQITFPIPVMAVTNAVHESHYHYCEPDELCLRWIATLPTTIRFVIHICVIFNGLVQSFNICFHANCFIIGNAVVKELLSILCDQVLCIGRISHREHTIIIYHICIKMMYDLPTDVSF